MIYAIINYYNYDSTKAAFKILNTQWYVLFSGVLMCLFVNQTRQLVTKSQGERSPIPNVALSTRYMIMLT